MRTIYDGAALLAGNAALYTLCHWLPCLLPLLASVV